jgi:TPR repeat protein
MNTNNNCHKEDYVEDLTAAMGKLEGGSGMGNTNDISDEFKQSPLEEDCPICLLRLPTNESGSIYKPCCGKIICIGCDFAPVYDNLGNVIKKKKCPFCRTPVHRSDEEYNERLQKRVELDDVEAMYHLGCNYRDGDDGFPQDYTKALELFVRAGELGYAKAINSIGRAYENGRAVKKDKKKAKYYYKLAAIGGEPLARHNLGVFEWDAGNWERALKHWLVAAGGGYNISLKDIQKLYTNGHATKEDYATALRAYQAYLAEIKSTQRDKAAAVDDEKYY